MAGKQGEPPTEQARVQMFMSSVSDYNALQDALPLPDSITLAGPARPPADRWVAIMHAMVLRKFFFGTDHLNLVTVVTAIRACVIDHREGMDETFDALAVRAAGHSTSSYIGSVVNDGPTMGEAALTIDDLYGRYMHGDHDRWERSQKAAGVPSELAMFIWTTDARNILLLISSAVELGLKEGSIAF